MTTTPTNYVVSYSFSGWQASNPTTPLPAQKVDIELANIATSVNTTISALSDVRRSDGFLNNGVVTLDSLNSSVLSLLALTGSTLYGGWVTGIAYPASAVVSYTNVSYYCMIAHTSGVFATDFAAGKWAAMGGGAASAITFVPTGTISSTTVQNAIAETSGDVTAEVTRATGAEGTLTAAITAINANSWVTSARIATGAVGSGALASNAVTTAAINALAVTVAKISSGAAASGTVLTADGAGNAAFLSPYSYAVQQVRVETGAVATGTTVIPLDDTIPQSTEGDQYMSLTITPKSTTSKLVIHAEAIVSNSASSNNMLMALFQDSTANALAAVINILNTGSNILTIPLTHVMTSGTTSATTFKIRIGAQNAGTTTFNGGSGLRYMGGVMASSIVITEYAS